MLVPAALPSYRSLGVSSEPGSFPPRKSRGEREPIPRRRTGLFRGTDSSNPLPSSAESCANSTSSTRIRHLRPHTSHNIAGFSRQRGPMGWSRGHPQDPATVRYWCKRCSAHQAGDYGIRLIWLGNRPLSPIRIHRPAHGLAGSRFLHFLVILM